ncbi:hypothetical protein BJ508DRAFT_417739 [Ascobolus immersus RN42]|uniref:Uncharacterized protein n=1 Tax=Ascobolus immersus RN42 TaxID=1160509 RepID=A0A3N4HUB9_ASCIM|nr:hypothetical protein BJ508DRAFT_417739 [Ascobolus immersus RN42]
MTDLPSPAVETNPFRRKHTSAAPGTTTPPAVQFAFDSAFEAPPASGEAVAEDPWAVRPAKTEEVSTNTFDVVEASKKLAKLELEETKEEDLQLPESNAAPTEALATPELPDATPPAPPPVETPPAPPSPEVPQRPQIPSRPSSNRGPAPPPPPPHAKRVDSLTQQSGLKYSRSRRGPRPPPPPRPASRKGTSSLDVTTASSASTSTDALSVKTPQHEPSSLQTPSNESRLSFSEPPPTTFPTGSPPPPESRPALDRAPPSTASLSSPIDLRPPPLERAAPSSDSINSRRSIDQNPFRRVEQPQAEVPAVHIGRAQTSPVEPTSSFSFDDVVRSPTVPDRPKTVPAVEQDDPATLRSAAIDASLASLTGGTPDPEDPITTPTRPALPAARPPRRSTYGVPTTNSRPSSSAGPPPPPPPARRISVRPSPAASSNRISRYGMPPPPPPPPGSRHGGVSPGGLASPGAGHPVSPGGQMTSSPLATPQPRTPQPLPADGLKSDSDSAVSLPVSVEEVKPAAPEPREAVKHSKEKPLPTIPADLEIEGEKTAELDDDLEREILGLEA